MAVDPHHVSVTDFGALGDNSHDDGPAIREAHEYCATHRPGSYLPLHFPIGRYLIASGPGIPLKNHMHWTGEGHHATETDARTQIRMNSDHMFKFDGANADWCTFTGICFDGRNQTKCFLEPADIYDANSRILYHSQFLRCGWKNFDHAFNGRLSGVEIFGSFFQNNKCGLKASGADNIIHNNYMSGSNWKAGGNSDPGGGPETFAVVLGSFRLCWFEKNYITGWPQMHLKITGSVDGTIFDKNRFDICDMSGLYMENSIGGIFTGNTFNRCMLGQDAAITASSGTTNPLYDAIVRMKNCTDMLFLGNYFGYMDNGLPKGDPINTFHLTNCDRIQIANNNFRDPYVREDVAD